MDRKFALTFYQIHWVDAETESGWNRLDDINIPHSLCLSHGYFIKQDETYLTIAADFDPGANIFNRFIHIPLVNIKKKRKIKL